MAVTANLSVAAETISETANTTYLKSSLSSSPKFEFTLDNASLTSEINANITERNLNGFDICIEEINQINLQLEILSENNSLQTYNEEIADLLSYKDMLYQKLKLYGADTIEDDNLQDILLYSDYSHITRQKSYSTSFTDSQLAQIVSQLKSSYDTVGMKSTYNDGNKNYSIYEIYVSYNGSSVSADKLTKTSTKQFYGAISPNSSEASNWINEVIQVYIQKGTSSLLEMIPGLKYLPYELLFTSKPSPSQVSFTGNGLVCTLSTNNSIKFTYVLDDSKNSWVYCASSNSVNSAFTCTTCKFVGNQTQQITKNYPNRTFDGGYSTSKLSAVNMFKMMKDASYNISAANLGINSVSYETKYKGSLSHDILKPSAPIWLI